MNQIVNSGPADQIVWSFQKSFEQVALSPEISESFKREAFFAVSILRENNYLLGIANRNQDSFKAAIMNVAAFGLTLNPAEKKAYLIPRKGKVCLDISYMGLVDIACKSGMVYVQARIVHKNDHFQIMGIDKEPEHHFKPFGDRGAIAGVYCVAKLETGEFLTEAMSIEDIYKIRDRSESYKKKSGPWVSDEGEMIKKTVVRRASKMWPKRDTLLDQAIHELDKQEEINFEAEREAHEAQARKAREEQIQQASKETEEKFTLIEQVKEDYNKLGENLTLAQKGEFLAEALRIQSLDSLRSKSFKQIKEIHERILLEIKRLSK